MFIAPFYLQKNTFYYQLFQAFSITFLCTMSYSLVADKKKPCSQKLEGLNSQSPLKVYRHLSLSAIR